MRISDWSSDVCSSDLAAFGEEEPEAELAHLRAVEVVAQAEHVGEVVRADLHRRFADLERRLAHRMRVALDHGHAQGGVLPPQLDRQRQPGEDAAVSQSSTAIVMTLGLCLDRKSTRLNSSTNAYLVCRLLLERKKEATTKMKNKMTTENTR